jgi:small subunit ribosomal protein S16
MSVKIRLSRGGAKKRPFYRIVIADTRMPRDGRYVERVGTFNPMVPKDHDDRLKFKEDRIKYWLSVGAKPTNRVARFLSEHGLVDKPVVHEQTKQHLPRQKTLDRLEAKAEEDKAKADAAASAASAEEAAPAEETAAVEAPAEEAAAEEAPAEEPKAEAAEENKEEEKTDG